MSDANPVDQVKDFRYYAELAEDWLYTAEQYAPQMYNPRLFDHAMKAADVYSRLAATAPEPTSQRIELHDAACPCIKK